MTEHEVWVFTEVKTGKYHVGTPPEGVEFTAKRYVVGPEYPRKFWAAQVFLPPDAAKLGAGMTYDNAVEYING